MTEIDEGPSIELLAEKAVEKITSDPVAVFTDAAKFEDALGEIKGVIDAFVPDITTDKGRKAIASLAYKVTRSKTALDAAGLALTEDWRAQTAKVNQARKRITEVLGGLAVSVRKPLTDWETRGKAAAAAVEAIKALATITQFDTAETVEKRGRELHARVLDPALYGDLLEEAETAKAESVRALAKGMHQLRQIEADRAELERLRKEKEERDRLDREADEAAAREEAARVAAEREKARAEQAEIDRKELEEKAFRDAANRATLARVAADEAAAREEERKRQDAELRASRIASIKSDIANALNKLINGDDLQAIAEAIFDGKVRHVEVKL